ncbi:MutT/nudix family protein [Taphrina deformans PYCC 5710]|uniref:MutT/nudix family protein n=1 Tax=Taphrina deformans (strain PYCC 5710 / ATCC 11124 / CBS 356.35 / IMI 108563 / JCM 9778 / NBRC 8474) TaxID=1097556 RepID=R4X6D4_TAPDE|nr:MutT/nudix family protein [Taphrina deformans PYCC 5710]|eukprot:CCG80624.1 MutT/nudix family protein [Taphrina deformans PYCC 5710]
MSSAKPSNGSKILNKTDLSLDDAKWTTLKNIDWRDPTGKERVWESAERVTNKSSTTGAVGIIALLKSPGKKTRIILEKQFRPPLDAICVEVPAGLMDEGESAEQTAERELKEETGYVGKAVRTSYLLYNDPGFTNTTTYLVYVDVDLQKPENVDLKPEQEAGEFIEIFTPEVETLDQTLQQLENQGYAIDGRLGAFAAGISAVKLF